MTPEDLDNNESLKDRIEKSWTEYLKNNPDYLNIDQSWTKVALFYKEWRTMVKIAKSKNTDY